MDPDMNHYDLAHVTTAHPKMSGKAWQDIYQMAWEAYYTPAHVETLIRRGKAWGFAPFAMMMKLLCFHACARIERMHPLEGGLFRLKFRNDRRPGMPREKFVIFYGRYLWDMVSKYSQFFVLVVIYLRALYRAERGASKIDIADLAMKPVRQVEVEALALSQTT